MNVDITDIKYLGSVIGTIKSRGVSGNWSNPTNQMLHDILKRLEIRVSETSRDNLINAIKLHITSQTRLPSPHAAPIVKQVLFLTLANDHAIAPQNDFRNYLVRTCRENVSVTEAFFASQSELESELKKYDHNLALLVLGTHSTENSIMTGYQETATIDTIGQCDPKMLSLISHIQNAVTPNVKLVLTSCKAARHIANIGDVEIAIQFAELNGEQIPVECKGTERNHALQKCIYRFGDADSDAGVAWKFAKCIKGSVVFATACVQVSDEITVAIYNETQPFCGNGPELNVGVLSNKQRMYVLEYQEEKPLMTHELTYYEAFQ